MAELIRDDFGVPIPQYQSGTGNTFEASQGSEGALHVKVLESQSSAIGTTTDIAAPVGDGTLIALTKAMRDILALVDNHIQANGTVTVANPVTSVSVSNQPTQIGINNFPASFDIDNFPTEVGINNFPSTFAVSNVPTQIGVNNFPLNRASEVIIGAKSVSTEALLASVGVTNKANRIKLLIINNSEADKIYIGDSIEVTVATGLPIKPGDRFEIELQNTNAQNFYLITDASSAVDVRILEYS